MLTQSQEKYQEVLQVAEKLYRQSPDWVTFFRKILGVHGAVRRNFPSLDRLNEFEQSEEYDRIQKMLVKLREQRITIDEEEEPTRVITVRLPKSMHESLRSEAHDLRTSMNKLCISKLLQVIGEDLIPNERPAADSEASSRTTSGSSAGANHAPTGNSAAGNSAAEHPAAGEGALPPVTGSPSAKSFAPQSSPATPPPFKPTQSRF